MRSDIGTFRDLGIDTVACLTPSVQSDASAPQPAWAGRSIV